MTHFAGADKKKKITKIRAYGEGATVLRVKSDNQFTQSIGIGP